MRPHPIVTCAALATACFAGSTAYAGTPAFKTTKPVEAIPSESCVSGTLGVEVVSEYIRHGIVQENQGLIIQPYANMHFRLAKGAGMVDSINADIGVWNSFQDHNRTPSTTSNWAEFDFTAGLTFNIKKLSISPQFKVYESPNDSRATIYTLGCRIAYDDRDCFGDFALHPYVFIESSGIFDVKGSTGNGVHNQRAGGSDQYYEFGIAPRHSFGDLTLSLPISGGIASRFYVGDYLWGFYSFGIAARYELPFVQACLGKWSVHTGASYYRLSRGAAAKAGSFDDRDQWVFGGGLEVTF